MFDQLKGMAGIAGLLKDLPRVRARIERVKEDLGGQTVDAETGGGAVRVTVNGLLRVVSVRVDQALLATLVDVALPEDRGLAEELIAGAVNAGMEKARRLAEREFAAAAAEMGIPIPPGGFGALMG